jgi:hypothetical protein
MGGCQDAQKYLLNTDQYNDKLFQVALWTVNDAVAPSDSRSQSTLSQTVKHIIANDSLIYRPMYGSGGDLEWLGRPVLTMNNDPESMKLFPHTDNNILDKLMLLLMQRIPVPGWEMTDEQIEAELPFFGAFLRDWPYPVYTLPPSPRFGVAAYAHPDLLETAQSTSPTASFEELLSLWRNEWFAAGGAGEGTASWTGSPTQLMQAIVRNETLRNIMAPEYRLPNRIGIHLNKLLAHGCSYLTNPSSRIYAISRPN